MTARVAPATAGIRSPDEDFANVTLWAAQAVVGFLFCFFGLFKLAGSLAELAAVMKWPGEFPPYIVRVLGAIDILGGVGIVLPALTRIAPRITVLAAACATALQICAIAFHSMRGEFAVLPLNALLLPLAVYVLWGRSRRVVIAPLDAAAQRQRFVQITLWAAQFAAAAVFCSAGLFKLTAPIVDVRAALAFANDFPVAFVRFVGAVDLAGGLGLLLPALTRIAPRLTPLAALGCTVVQLLAISLHVSRGEFSVLPLNALLLAASLYVLIGRLKLAPVAPIVGAAARQRALTVTLWTAQAVVAIGFVAAGQFKLSAPIPALAAAMKWPGEFPEAMVRLIGAIDLAGGLGILLPALTRILPRLTVLAALGCSVLQTLAIAFHLSRGEGSVVWLNFVLLVCALYVLWGRARARPLAARA